MKKLALCIVLLIAVWSPALGQQYFSDNFDSYTSGSYLGLQSSQWRTWSSTTGGNSEDVYVSNADALSGSQSIYFYSANGNGPHDAVLDFGGVHNSGKFTYKANYKIPSNKNSYFNFQGGSNVAQQWSLDFYFNAGGTWNCQGGSGTFTHGQWFEFLIDVDFDTDTWKVYIDGSLQATFTNTNPISYLDLYEVVSNSEWYMDDVSFCVNNGCNPELKVDSLKISPNTVCTYHESDVSVKVTNNSTFPAPSMVLGINVGPDKLSQAVNLNNLGAGKDTTITLAGLFKASISGTNIPVEAINLSGDIDASNDTAKSTVTVLPSPSNTNISKGSPYESPRMGTAGTNVDPDIVAAGDTLSYEIIPPSGKTNATYGSAWDISNLTFYTANGTVIATSYYTFNAASSGTNATISFSPDAALTDSSIIYSLEVNDLGNLCDTVIKHYISVVPEPDAQFSQLDVCDQEAMAFTNNSTLQSGSMSFLWMFGDGATSTLTNPTHTYTSFGTYTVQLFATSNFGYVDSFDMQVTVFQLPTADFTISNACEGSDLSFSNNSFLPSGTPSFAWDFGDGTTGPNAQNTSHMYAVPGNYSITMTVTINGCSESKSKYGTQAPRAVPSFTSSVACNNTKAEFSNGTTLLFGTYGSHWKFGDGSEGSSKDALHNYIGFGAFDVTLIITTDLGCIDSSRATITTIESPKPDFSLSNACSDELITMNNLTNTPGGTGNSYMWSFGNGLTSTNENPTTAYPGPGNFTVKLIAFNGNGCFDSIMKKVIIDTKPIAGFIAKDVCFGTPSAFMNNTVNLPNGGSYIWDFGNGVTSNVRDTTFVYATAGDYTVKLIVSTINGCYDTTSSTVAANPLPDPSFVVESGLKGDGTMVFTANATGNVSYHWFTGDGSKYQSQIVIHRYMVQGNYEPRLIVESDKGCSNEHTESVSITPTGLQSMDNADLVIYPNPTNGSFSIRLSQLDAPTFIAIYATNGQLIKELDVNQWKDGALNVRLDSYNPGVYVVRVQSEFGTWNKRIILN